MLLAEIYEKPIESYGGPTPEHIYIKFVFSANAEQCIN